jgi:hypothetical protein
VRECERECESESVRERERERERASERAREREREREREDGGVKQASRLGREKYLLPRAAKPLKRFSVGYSRFVLGAIGSFVESFSSEN